MEQKHVQLLTTLTNPERCRRYQRIILANLNGDYTCLTRIFEIRTIYVIVFSYISKVLCTILIGITANKWQNFFVSSCIILMDKILEFLVICMYLDTVLMNMLKEHYNMKILHIFAIMIIILFDDSIDYLVFVVVMTITLEIINIQMIKLVVLIFICNQWHYHLIIVTW